MTIINTSSLPSDNQDSKKNDLNIQSNPTVSTSTTTIITSNSISNATVNGDNSITNTTSTSMTKSTTVTNMTNTSTTASNSTVNTAINNSTVNNVSSIIDSKTFNTRTCNASNCNNTIHIPNITCNDSNRTCNASNCNNSNACNTVPHPPSSFAPLIPILNFEISPLEIVPLVKMEIESMRGMIDEIVTRIPRDQRTFNNTIEILMQKETEFSTRLSVITFLQHISTSPLIRQASVEATMLLNDYSIERATRRDVYEMVKDVARMSGLLKGESLKESLKRESGSLIESLNPSKGESIDSIEQSKQSESLLKSLNPSTESESFKQSESESPFPLNKEQTRLVEKILLDFKKCGLDLPSAILLEEFKEKQKRLSQLTVEFAQALSEDQTRLLFTKEELLGCTQDFIDSLSQEEEEKQEGQEGQEGSEKNEQKEQKGNEQEEKDIDTKNIKDINNIKDTKNTIAIITDNKNGNSINNHKSEIDECKSSNSNTNNHSDNDNHGNHSDNDSNDSDDYVNIESNSNNDTINVKGNIKSNSNDKIATIATNNFTNHIDIMNEKIENIEKKYVITMSYPDVFGVLRRASNEQTRRLVDIAFNSRCSSNGPRLEEAIQLRRECAQLLGYKNHAEYQLEERLAKTIERIDKFEHDLTIKLKPLGESELTSLKALKSQMERKETIEINNETNSKTIAINSKTNINETIETNINETNINEINSKIIDSKTTKTINEINSKTTKTVDSNANINETIAINKGINSKTVDSNANINETIAINKGINSKTVDSKTNINEGTNSKIGNETSNEISNQSTQFNTWDLGFYSRILQEKQCSIDEELVRQYFPIDHVIEAMLSIYQRVLGLKFLPTQLIPRWHEDVQAFQVQDAETNELIGFFYLDLFPRPGKYTHAACFPIHSGYQRCILTGNDNDNQNHNSHGHVRQLPVSAIVANFTKPSSTLSSLSTFTLASSLNDKNKDKNCHNNQDNNQKCNNSNCDKNDKNCDNNQKCNNSNCDKNDKHRDNPQIIPSLLKHSEVVTLFHELGHAMHGMCSQVQYARFHGTSVETDFVEAPSQMLENWCWEPKVLLELGKHYKTGERMPISLIDNLIMTRRFLPGLSYLRQVMFGVFDMTIHSIVDKDLSSSPFKSSLLSSSKRTINHETIDSLYSRLRKEISLIGQISQLHPASSFGHLMGGYDAGYYGYLWSEVFSIDMYETKFSIDPMNPKIGMEYRREILQPGGSRDGMESLKAFLGREPMTDAFYKSIGIN